MTGDQTHNLNTLVRILSTTDACFLIVPKPKEMSP